MIVSFTIIRYRKRAILFALLAMAIHRLWMVRQQGCSFWKLLGSGHNGTFDLKPDLQQWGLLAVWDDKAAFDKFYADSNVCKWWKRYANEQWTLLCEPLQSHGKWDGKEPFGNPDIKDHEGRIAILTRATIRAKKLKRFWGHVDVTSDLMRRSRGYITSFGVGEAPLLRQATFSIWESLEDVKAFAYGSKEHADVIKKTRAEGWYSEELFARFKLIDSFGAIKEKDPLDGRLVRGAMR